MTLRTTAQRHVRANEAWVERLARAGYLARALVYATVGALALNVALGNGGRALGPKGAVQSLSHGPFGKVLLAIIAAGLIGLILWRLSQAIFVRRDARGSGVKHAAKPWLHRVRYLGLSVLYSGLVTAAIRGLLGQPGGDGEDAPRAWSAQLMALPFGRVLVLAIGVGIAGYGIWEIFKAYSRKFEKNLHLTGLAARRVSWVTRVSQFGLASRGGVFLLMGGFLGIAAIDFDPSEAKGLGATLLTVSSTPLGDLALVVVSLGLVAFAVYCALQARYRHFEVSQL